VFDDWFATVAASIESLPDFNSPEWAQMFGDSTFHFDFDEDDETDTVDLNGDITEALHRSHHAVARAMERYRPDTPLIVPPPAAEPLARRQPVLVESVTEDSDHSDLPMRPPRPPLTYPTRASGTSPTREPLMPPPREALLPPSREPTLPSTTSRTPLLVASRQPREKTEKVMTPAPSSPDPTGLRRSSRKNFGKPAPRLIPGGYLSTDFLVAEQPEFSSIYAANGVPQPYAYKATNSDPDTLSYEEAMSDVDRVKWIAAAEK
jgi:hypothetical protein